MRETLSDSDVLSLLECWEPHVTLGKSKPRGEAGGAGGVMVVLGWLRMSCRYFMRSCRTVI